MYPVSTSTEKLRQGQTNKPLSTGSSKFAYLQGKPVAVTMLYRGPTKHRKELQGTFKPSNSGPTKHRKELQGTENSAKNYKELQDTFKRSTK